MLSAAARRLPLRFLQVEPTTRCNYTCGFCAGRRLPQGDLDPAVLREVLDRIEGLEHVELQGEGEPMLHPRFFALLELVRERFPAAHVSLITNGSLLSDESVGRLLDAGLRRICISMESADPERFRRIRGGRFERVERGLQALMHERRRRGAAAPTVGLAVTFLRETVDEARETVLPLYRRLGLDGGILLQPLQAMPAYVRFYDAALKAQLPGPATIERLRRHLDAEPALAAALQDRARSPGFFEALYASTAGQPACPWLEHGLFLGQDAAFAPCCFVKDTASHALARGAAGLPAALAARAAMAGRLAAGEVPPACEGCPLAQGIAAAAR